ncbi:UDP-N-acetylmuramoyl-L-alanyl-D-glutamate--2,6-diaminopimelate ligase [Streptomyces sp. MnatMP-M17]|nr:UDP-N-acetylmuramoyl-L-alanyl-D-glutamate--2,6-diaminopimelate ligase [Streptomyces sp. MnatMP-M17]
MSPPEAAYLLGYMRDRGTGTVVLEATSMGLLTHRVDHAFADVGVFTNLTQDHLDDHGTMENYRDAELRLFQGLCRRAVVNADDPAGAGIAALMPGAVTTYALDAEADYRATDLTMDAFGTRFTLQAAGQSAFASLSGAPSGSLPRTYSSGRLTTIASCVLRAITTTASSSALGFSSRCGTYGGTKM